LRPVIDAVVADGLLLPGVVDSRLSRGRRNDDPR